MRMAVTSSAFRFAFFSTLTLLAVAVFTLIDLPLAPSVDGRAVTGEPAVRSRALVAPVRRVMPKTPPLPEAILAAGDVEEPSRAPDVAPVPVRRDAALARAALAADTAAFMVEPLLVPVPRRVALRGGEASLAASKSVD